MAQQSTRIFSSQEMSSCFGEWIGQCVGHGKKWISSQEEKITPLLEEALIQEKKLSSCSTGKRQSITCIILSASKVAQEKYHQVQEKSLHSMIVSKSMNHRSCDGFSQEHDQAQSSRFLLTRMSLKSTKTLTNANEFITANKKMSVKKSWRIRSAFTNFLVLKKVKCQRQCLISQDSVISRTSFSKMSLTSKNPLVTLRNNSNRKKTENDCTSAQCARRTR